MPTFQFRCPNKNLDVQAYTAEEIGTKTDIVEVERCLACGKSHFVHLKAGRAVQTAD